MSAIDAVSASADLQILGWTLVHAVWQVALVALLLELLLRARRRMPSELRYGLACLALAICCALPATTAWSIAGAWGEHQQCWRIAESGRHAPSEPCQDHGILASDHGKHAAALGGAVRPDPLYARSLGLTRPLAWVAALWSAGVVLLLLRTALLWRRALGLRTRGAAPLRGPLAGPLGRAARRLGIGRRVALLVSTRVDVPLVVGWRRPAVLFPRAVLQRLPLHELETVLAHELAHVRRHDFAANLLQTVAEALLFFHPAARRISRRIREEREFCCDEVAVRSMPASLPVYLRALVAIDALRPGSAQEHALAITGGALLPRARRLASGAASQPPVRPHRAALVLLLGGALLWAPAAKLDSARRLSAWAVMTLDLSQRRAAPPRHGMSAPASAHVHAGR